MQTILITGTDRSVGLALAMRYANRRYKVTATARTTARAITTGTSYTHS